MASSRFNYRVVKAIASTHHGAIGLDKQYEATLIGDHFRRDAIGKVRRTAVELPVLSAQRANQSASGRSDPG